MMPVSEIHHLHARILKAMSHPVRVAIMTELIKGEKCFSELQTLTGGLKSGLSQHLSILTEHGLLRMRKDRRCNYYCLSSVNVAKAIGLIDFILRDTTRKRSRILKLQ